MLELSDVAVPGPAEIGCTDRVIRNQANRGRPNEEAVVVVVRLTVIAAVMKAELGRIPLRQEILEELAVF